MLETFADWLRWYREGLPATGPTAAQWRRILRVMAQYGSPQLVTLEHESGEYVITIVEVVHDA